MKSAFTIILLFFFLNLHGQERYVNLDGQKFRIKEFGTGDLTVIFESGMSDSLEAWGAIPDTVALFAHVFLYDRADIGKSDSSGQKRTIPNMVSELKSILNHESINPPYILVGHSLGGYITRYFSSQYPDDVTGLLLLDPAPEAYWESMTKEELKKYIEGGTEWYRTKYAPKYWKEWFQFIPNIAYMKNLNISRDLPIILVSASESNWYKYHEKIIAGFKSARHVELVGGHYIHRSHPDLIIKYIKELSSINK
jgi:alpha/beta hydrolase fold